MDKYKGPFRSVVDDDGCGYHIEDAYGDTVDHDDTIRLLNRSPEKCCQHHDDCFARDTVEWQTNAPPAWIPVSERLPEPRVPVLVFGLSSLGEPVVDAGLIAFPGDQFPWSPVSVWGYEWEWEFSDRNPTHWQPLPNPPAADKTEHPASSREGSKS